MGAVYRAKHVGLGQEVAFKLLRGEKKHDHEAVQRFLREAKAAAAITSPHVVQVTDFGVSADGEPFLVMELVGGTDLERHIARKQHLSADEAVGIVLDVLAGLGAAHAAGIVHRDLKAANVLLGADIVKVADFGISKLIGDVALDTLTRTGVALGTPYAMAPEQAKNARDVDARADLWAVGVLLYHALSGKRPFEGTSYEDLIVKLCTEDAPPLPDVVPAPLAAVVMRALARDRTERWASAAEMSSALRQAMRDIEVAAAPPEERDDDEAPLPASSDPALRPSLAFDARPRRSWRLPLALVGFTAAAGGLLWMAIVLRPVVPAAPAAAAGPPAAAPSTEYEVRFHEMPAAAAAPAPVVSVVTPSAGVDGDDPGPIAELASLEVRGPIDRDEVEHKIALGLRRLEPFREERAVTRSCDITVLENGNPRFVDLGSDPVCAALFMQMRFEAADRTSRITVELRLAPVVKLRPGPAG